MKIIFLFFIFINLTFASNLKIVAKVNDTSITEYDYDNFARNYKGKMRDEILDLLIEITLKNDIYTKENVKFNEAEFKESGIKSKDDYMWYKFVDKVIKSRVYLTRAEIEDNLEYIGEKNKIIRFNISQIMLKNSEKNKEVIYKLYEEIRDNDNFEKIAKTFSEVNKENAGYFGWLYEKEMNGEIYENVKNLLKGSITKPFKVNDYYVIAKLNDKEEQKVSLNNENVNKMQYLIYNKKILLEAQKYYEFMYNNALIEKM
ncbi:MAG: peptidylprolyl isomerase [Rickettsiales bacterium]|jgi:parvulin-like peptidyl-prolyl isomerase|nr:peptidylprolyl isomerase [Rickettsiales bacterium]